MENQTQNLTPNIKCENKIIYKTDTNGEQEQPDKTVQSEDDTNTISKPVTSKSNVVQSTISTEEFHNVIKDQDTTKYTESKEKTNELKNSRECSSSENSAHNRKVMRSTESSNESSENYTQTNQYKSFFAGCSLGSENFEFARWMDSRDDSYSLWSTEKHRYQLLSYIGKIYGQKHNIRHVLAPLRIGFNKLGAQDSLRGWQLQTRPDHRIVEIKAMFEFNRTCPSSLGDLKMSSSSSDLKEIINRASINAYFDMICRDGSTTAEIGEY
ncbi:unnamed protein product, partial [Rotaria sp. Silwood1]